MRKKRQRQNNSKYRRADYFSGPLTAPFYKKDIRQIQGMNQQNRRKEVMQVNNQSNCAKIIRQVSPRPALLPFPKRPNRRRYLRHGQRIRPRLRTHYSHSRVEQKQNRGHHAGLLCDSLFGDPVQEIRGSEDADRSEEHTSEIPKRRSIETEHRRDGGIQQ